MSSRRTTRAALAALALAVFGLVLAGLVAPATAATSTGKIKGVVSVAGQPVKNAKVQLYTHLRGDADDVAFAYDRTKTVSTDSAGRYSFTGVKTGTWRGGPKYLYAVLVTDRSGKGAKTVRYVKVTKNRTTTRSVSLKPAVVLTGAVTRSDGGSPAELTVVLSSNETRNDTDPLNEEFFPDSATPVRADGTFTVKGQAAGGFQVLVKGDAYLGQCYDFETNTLEECLNRPGADVSLTAGERRALAPVVATKLAPPVSKISGKVTDTSGKALKGIGVRITGDSGEVTATTRSSGRFNVQARIPAGAYTVRFDDPKAVWASQYLGGGPDKAVRRQVTVTPGQPLGGLNTKLKSISTVKTATKAGIGSAKIAVRIKRKASGSAPGGSLTVSSEGVTKTVVVAKGKATVTLTGLPRGVRSLVAKYSGTSTTAGFSKIVKVTVK